MAGDRIIDVDDVAEGETVLFTVCNESRDCREAILVFTGEGEVRAWLNYCQHWTDVRLDRGDGASIRGDEIVCQKHGALFRIEDGFCTAGPCSGASLEPVEIRIKNGNVVLTDDGYEFVSLGGFESESLSSRGGVGFD